MTAGRLITEAACLPAKLWLRFSSRVLRVFQQVGLQGVGDIVPGG